MGRVSSARLPGLDTLRAVAIVAVMLYHLEPFLPERLAVVGQFGWMGVDLFFVLSGYLIGSQLLKPYVSGDEPSLREFYRRRAYRILPAYLVVLLLYYFFPAWRESEVLPPLWQFVTFTVNLFVNMRHHAFSHVWSLCVEEHFYLVLPLLVIWAMRRPSARWTVIFIAAVVLFGVVVRGSLLLPLLKPFGWDGGRVVPENFGSFYFKYLYYPTYARLDGLVAGVTLALIRLFRPGWWEALARRGHAALAVGVGCVGAVCWMFRDVDLGEETRAAAWATVVGFPLLACGLGLVVASSISRNGWLSRLRVPGARMMATLAYSLYLMHKEIAHVDRVYLPALTANRDWRTVVVYGVSCLVGAGMLYVGVERPFMGLRDRIGRRGVVEMRGEPAL